MKKPSPDLFHLVQSLTPKEKRYFRLFVSLMGSGGEKVYVKLFEAIGQMKSYDENELKSKYRGEAFVHQLSSHKNYLFHTLLKSLSLYHAENSEDFILYDMLKKAELLYKKGLFDACSRIVAAGKKQALSAHKYAIYELFLNWQIRLEVHSTTPDRAMILLEELQRIYELQRVSISYRIGLFLLNNKTLECGFYLTPKAQREIKAVHKRYGFHQPLHPDADKVMTHYYYFANNLYYMLINDPYRRAFFVEKALNNLESQKDFYENNPNFYLGTLVNFCDAMIEVGRMKHAFHALQKMRAFADKLGAEYRILKSFVKVISLNFELCIYNLTNRVTKAISLENDVKAIIGEYAPLLSKSNLNDLSFAMAYSLFLAGNYNKSLDWLNEIITQHKLRFRDDIYISARILSLMAHYELGNCMLLSRSVHALIKYLKIHNKLEEPLSILLHFLRTASTTKDSTAKEDLLLETKSRLDEVIAQKKFVILKYIDLDCWIESKITAVPIAVLIKQKYMLKNETPIESSF